jgi:hypothetical protein
MEAMGGTSPVMVQGNLYITNFFQKGEKSSYEHKKKLY